MINWRQVKDKGHNVMRSGVIAVAPVCYLDQKLQSLGGKKKRTKFHDGIRRAASSDEGEMVELAVKTGLWIPANRVG